MKLMPSKIPFIESVTLDIPIHIFSIPDLELPRIVKITFIFKVNMNTKIAVLIAKIQIF